MPINVAYYGHTFDKYSHRGHFVSIGNNDTFPRKSINRGYYRTTERPWQSTRPLPDPESINGTPKYPELPCGALIRDRMNTIDRAVTYDVLESEMVPLSQAGTDSDIIHDYQNTTLHKGSIAI